jgi:hypothetical protein
MRVGLPGRAATIALLVVASTACAGGAPTGEPFAGASSAQRAPPATTGRPSPDAPGEIAPGDVLRFSRFPVYWLGPSFRGLPLTYARWDHDPTRPHGAAYPGRVNRLVLIYGTCQPDPAQSAGGCSPPLQVHVAPSCGESLTHLGMSVWPDGRISPPRPYGPGGDYRPVRLRGVPAAEFDGGYWLLTGATSIRIMPGAPGLLADAAQALVPANDAAVREARGDVLPGAPLAPPVPGVLGGTLRCPEAPDEAAAVGRSAVRWRTRLTPGMATEG